MRGYTRTSVTASITLPGMRQHARLTDDPQTFTRRTYLACRTMLDTGCDIFVAMEAVSSTAIEHPEWDMDERRTWAEWEQDEWCP